MSEEPHLPPSDEPSEPSDAAMDFATFSAVMAAWEAPTPEETTGLFPGYEVQQLIGRGGMGAVYLARQVSLDRLVAIKLLPLEISRHRGFADNFQREARIMARLHHPNIIAVHDFGQTSAGHLFIVMEYVEGENLHEIIHQIGLDADQALSVIGKMCNALSYAHENGIVHRDIKPGNVMIDAASQVKVADFGLARLTDTGAEQMAVTQIAMGTPDYAAPEQSYGQPVDHRADIYALGVMLYEMLCRQVPRGAFQMPSVRVGCDVRIDAIVVKAMQQQPELRYQSTAELQADVERALKPAAARKPVPAGRAVVRPAPQPRPRRVTVPVAPKSGSFGLWIGLGIAALAVVGYFGLRPKTPPPQPVAAATPKPAPIVESKPKPVAPVAPVIAASTPRPEPPRPTPAPPALKESSVTGKWLAEEEPKWQEAFQREVTGPFEKDAGEMKRQHLAGISAQFAAATQAGQLDAALLWRSEAKRLTDGGEVPATDEAGTPPVLSARQANYRKGVAALEAVRERAGKAFAARYDAVLASSILALTQKQRLDEAIELKLKREHLAAEWEKRCAPILARAESTPSVPTTTTAGSGLSEFLGSTSERNRLNLLERNRFNLPDNTKVLVPTSQIQAQEWRYTIKRPQGNWFKPDFSDVNWIRGLGSFGTSETNSTRTVWKTNEIWLRRTFDMPYGVVAQRPHLIMSNDDDADVYLNGKKIGAYGWSDGYVLREVDREVWANVRVGKNSLAVYCRNIGGPQRIDVGIVDVPEPKAP